MVLFSFFFSFHGDHCDLHSFPTRRSSDLPLSIPDWPPFPFRFSTNTNQIEECYVAAKCSCRLQAFAHLQASQDRKSTRLNSSHLGISYAVFCLKKKNKASKYQIHPALRTT